MNDKLIIFDTTLRDGEQSPGASMTRDEKLQVARALEKMKVDVIEAGFPIASPGDFESVKAVAATIKDSTICGLARTRDADIDTAAEALSGGHAVTLTMWNSHRKTQAVRKLISCAVSLKQLLMPGQALSTSRTPSAMHCPISSGRPSDN